MIITLNHIMQALHLVHAAAPACCVAIEERSRNDGGCDVLCYLEDRRVDVVSLTSAQVAEWRKLCRDSAELAAALARKGSR